MQEKTGNACNKGQGLHDHHRTNMREHQNVPQMGTSAMNKHLGNQVTDNSRVRPTCDTCTPSPLCMPAQRMHMNAPVLMEAQEGRAAVVVDWQSAHVRFEGRDSSRCKSSRFALASAGVTMDFALLCLTTQGAGKLMYESALVCKALLTFEDAVGSR